VHLVLSFLWQGRYFGGLRRRPLAGVEAVKRGEEAEPVGGAHGLFQVTRLVHEFLDGVVGFHGAALDHLDGQEGGERGYMFLSAQQPQPTTNTLSWCVYVCVCVW